MKKAVILAAGKSQRLEKLGSGRPKPMIEIFGKPLLGYHLDRCAEIGVQEVFINLYHLPKMIRDYVGDGSAWGLKATFHLEKELSGTGGAVHAFEKHLLDGPFLVIYGDNYCTFGLTEIKDAFAKQKPDMAIVLFELEDTRHSGVAVCNADGSIASFIEKPAPGTTDSKLVNAGIYAMSPSLLKEIPEGFSDFGKELIPRFLAEGRRVLGVKTSGHVIAVDTPELLDQATRSRL